MDLITKHKKVIGGLLVAALLATGLSVPARTQAGPVIAVVAIIIAAVAVTDYVSCSINIVWGCGGGGGSGGGGGGRVQTPCTSSANACGQTNTGFTSGGSCSATPPPNSSCPAPVIAHDTGFYAQPSKVGTAQPSTLHWSASSATECAIAGDNGFSHSGTQSGSVSTGILSASTIFTLTCSDGTGGPSASANIKVILDPQYQEI